MAFVESIKIKEAVDSICRKKPSLWIAERIRICGEKIGQG